MHQRLSCPRFGSFAPRDLEASASAPVTCNYFCADCVCLACTHVQLGAASSSSDDQQLPIAASQVVLASQCAFWDVRSGSHCLHHVSPVTGVESVLEQHHCLPSVTLVLLVVVGRGPEHLKRLKAHWLQLVKLNTQQERDRGQEIPFMTPPRSSKGSSSSTALNKALASLFPVSTTKGPRPGTRQAKWPVLVATDPEYDWKGAWEALSASEKSAALVSVVRTLDILPAFVQIAFGPLTTSWPSLDFLPEALAVRPGAGFVWNNEPRLEKTHPHNAATYILGMVERNVLVWQKVHPTVCPSPAERGCVDFYFRLALACNRPDLVRNVCVTAGPKTEMYSGYARQALASFGSDSKKTWVNPKVRLLPTVPLPTQATVTAREAKRARIGEINDMIWQVQDLIGDCKDIITDLEEQVQDIEETLSTQACRDIRACDALLLSGTTTKGSRTLLSPKRPSVRKLVFDHSSSWSLTRAGDLPHTH